jgi:hypothetical protein
MEIRVTSQISTAIITQLQTYLDAVTSCIETIMEITSRVICVTSAVGNSLAIAFWEVRTCHVVEVDRRFGEICCAVH